MNCQCDSFHFDRTQKSRSQSALVMRGFRVSARMRAALKPLSTIPPQTPWHHTTSNPSAPFDGHDAQREKLPPLSTGLHPFPTALWLDWSRAEFIKDRLRLRMDCLALQLQRPWNLYPMRRGGGGSRIIINHTLWSN